MVGTVEHPVDAAERTNPGCFFDSIALGSGSSSFADAGFWNIAGGVIGGRCAAVFGLVDWFEIPDGTRAKRIGLFHAGSNILAVLGFIAVWWMRFAGTSRMATGGEFVLEVIALLFGAFGGWFGGELVDRLGVGIGLTCRCP